MEPLIIERAVVRVFETDTPLHVSFGSLAVRRMCLLEVYAGGLVGRGESWINWPAWAVDERVATLRDGVAPMLVGADAVDHVALTRTVLGRLLPLGRQWGAEGPIWQAISALDVALWDLHAQVSRKPIHSLLADDAASSVPVYASGVGPDDVTMLLERAREQGFDAAKLKIGFGRERDEKILAEARSVVGEEFTLFADANRAWGLDEAVEMTTVLGDHGIAWLEEPLDDDSPAGFAALYERGGFPLTLGENVYGTRAAEAFTALPGVAHLQPDLSKTGGISTMRDYADLTDGTACRLTPHSYGSALSVVATAQCAASLNRLGLVELDVRDNPFRTDVLREPLRVTDGRLAVPDVVALSDALDLDALAHLEVTR